MATVNAWAQVADVATLTGVTVTDSDVLQAQSIIEMFVNRTYAATTRMGTRDVAWLLKAVAYQAAWMQEQPDLFTRLDFAGLTMGGRAVQLKDDTLRIAPLAMSALKRVSWRKSRSLHVRSPFTDGLTPISPDPDSAGNDYYEMWSPT